jgi:hypothetical protein
MVFQESVGRERAAELLGLDSLASCSEERLEELYRRGSVPQDFFAREGRPKGRMLAVRRLAHGASFEGLRRIARSARFPWGGKSFFRVGPERGRGINRVRLGPARLEWYPFETRVETSLVDGRPTILLDYDKPENPFFIRRIRDEIREIEPGLFLGPAMWRDSKGGAAQVLWFALDFRDMEA